MPNEPSTPEGPRIRALDRGECDAILARNVVGRLAFAAFGRIDIEPLHYVADGEWLYGRTSSGTKLEALAHSPWVAFEVDEVEGVLDWRSVVVRGAIYLLEPERSAREQEAAARALELLRRITPAAGTPDDPTPFRTQLFRSHADEVTGRESSAG